MSSSLEIQKICLFCGKEFIAKKTTTQCCSLQCSQHAYKKRKREEKINAIRKKSENLQSAPLPSPIPISRIEIITVNYLTLIAVANKRHRYFFSNPTKQKKARLHRPLYTVNVIDHLPIRLVNFPQIWSDVYSRNRRAVRVSFKFCRQQRYI